MNDPSTRPQTKFFAKHLEAIWESLRLKKHLGSIWDASEKHLGSIWEASGKHLGSIWEASGGHLGLQEAMGLQEALGSNYCNTSAKMQKFL